MRKTICIFLIIVLVCIVLSGCNSDGEKSISLKETPQIYVLESENNGFMMMPTVTLYENGNASLSQPAISSFALIGIGRYELNGDELTVSHGEGVSATFIVSDGGNTLTIKSSDINYAQVGAVYKYLPDGWVQKGSFFIAPEKDYKTVEGEELTIDVLRELAGKAGQFTFSDFGKYACIELDPDYRVFSVGTEFTVRLVYTADGDTTCTVERNASGESFPLHLNGSTGLVFEEFLGIENVIEYKTREWLDYFFDDAMPWDESENLTLPEYPGVTFTWTPYAVTANGKELFGGMPVWNVFLADLTNDGKPEFCATINFGSGMIDELVIVYDYEEDKTYTLADRGTYNYCLSIDDGTLLFNEKLVVTRTDYDDSFDGVSGVTTELCLINGAINSP